MAASQVVLYFDKQEDALLFTLAASSVISADDSARSSAARAKIAEEISKASRITTAVDQVEPDPPKLRR
jgi:hypothetical protein